jgi:hypothetical protein
MIKSNLIFGCLLFSLTLAAQKNIYVGVEIGAANDRLQFFDDADHVVNAPLANVRAGMIIGYTFHNSLAIEAGVIRKNYKEGFGFDFETFESYNNSTSIRTWQFPLRLKPKVRVFEDNVFFTPTIGFNYCINLDHRFHSGGGGSGGSPEETLRYNYAVDYGLTRSFPLVETGLGIEVHVLKKASISFLASYFTGFKPVVDIDLIYTVNDGPDTPVQAHSKGEYASFYIGLRYPIIGRF